MIRKFLNPSGKLTYEEALRQAGERIEKERKDYLTTSNDNTWVERRNGKQKNKHLKKRGIKGAKSHALWKQEHPVLNVAGTVASAAPLAVAAYPFVAGAGELAYGLGTKAAATTVGQTLLPWIDAGLTSYFGAHGLNHAINEGIDGWGDAAMTALEVAPLGRLVKPVYEGVVQPGMRLFNSPLTGKWTTVGNKQYRLSPNSLGANGSSVEQRIPQITAENAASITPEQWTAAQDAAIARGDVVEAQRLRDLHFKTKSQTKILDENGNVLPSFHYSENKFTAFDPNKIGVNDPGFYGKGFYSAPDRKYASTYGENEYKLYINSKNPFRTNNSEDRSLAAFSFNRTDESPLIDIDKLNLRKELEGADAVWQKGVAPVRGDKPIEEIVVPNPNQIKLSDAVTYDNKGIRIPLGERDNFGINDIRYGLLPFGIGLTGYGLYNLFNQPLQRLLHYKQGGKMNTLECLKLIHKKGGKLLKAQGGTKFKTTGGAGYVPPNYIKENKKVK